MNMAAREAENGNGFWPQVIPKQNSKLPNDDLVVAGVICAGQIQQAGCDEKKHRNLVK